MPTNQSFSVKKDDWAAQWPHEKLMKLVKDLAIKRPIAGKRYDDRRSVGSTPGPTCSLHVICSPRRNVSKQYSVESTNIDTKLHGRGGRQ
jgi:hypothetical protein